ncbi:AMP-binding enzyme [Nocardioides sp.]|uniref:AMP-binding enzyme n=1 Tax=Nocardioides sp. TaxID=35761 RepID=UPI002B26B510|nr:AMP-binding protein [Nocardioides sp.]
MSTSSPHVSALRAWLASADGEGEPDPWVVETSGSSGRPKRVLLSRRAVLASVAATEERLGGSGPWVLRVPETYVAGTQVICRSLVAGHDPVGIDEPWPAGDGWFTSLVPTQLHRILEAAGSDLEALRRAHTVLLGGGPIDPTLRERAAAAGVRVVATYGSAETSGGCVYDGVPLDGVRVATADDGRLLITGPMLFDGYDGDPALTAETLVDGWFRTADAGEIDRDGPGARVRVLGRLDDVVVSGGVNVPGPAVAARLRAHPDVAAAEVLGVPDPEWGNRLVAFVVGAVSHHDLREWVAAAHPRAWAPRQVVVVPEIPLLANGKPDRQALLGLVGVA